MLPVAKNSVRSQFSRFLGDVFLGPLVVARGFACFVALRFLHATDEVHVSRKVRQALADNLLDRVKTFVSHELCQAVLQLIDHLHALKHHAGANLHGRSAQEHEFDRVVRVFDSADAADRNSFRQAQSELTDHAQSNGFDCLSRITAGHRVTFDGWHGPQGIEIDADDRKDCVDGRDALCAATNGGQRRLLDVCNVWSHLRPHGNLRDFCDPTSYFFSQVRMLTHLRSHLAFGHTVRTREVQLERINTRVLNEAGQFLPALFTILFHDRSDEDVVRILFFNLSEFFQPDLYRPIGNQFDVLEANHLAVVARAQLAVTRHDVDDLA